MVLSGLLGLIEGFFQLNHRYHWVKPGPAPLLKEGHLRLKAEQVNEKYGVNPLHVPEPIQSESARNQELLKLPGAQSGSYEPVNYLLQMQNDPVPRSFQVSLRLQAPYQDREIYSVEYKLDSRRRRIVENQKPNKKAGHFYLALGDSFTFGVGVNSGFDYPSQLAKISGPEWKIYNLAWPGSGPNDFLYRLQKTNESFADIDEPSGIAAWLFIPAQFERFLCSFECYTGNGKEYGRKPEYFMQDGKLQTTGSFNDSVSLKRKIYSVLAKSQTIQFSGLKPFSYDYSDEQIELTAEAFSEISKELKKKLPLKKFYVILAQNFSERRQLTAALEKRNIEVLNFFEVGFNQYQNFKLPFDSHPAPAYHWLFSQMVNNTILSEKN